MDYYLASVVIKDLLKLVAHFKSTIFDKLRFINLLQLLDQSYFINLLQLLDQSYCCYADDATLLSLPVCLSLPTTLDFTMENMEPVKNRLPLKTFGDFQDQNTSSSYCSEEMCAICLSCLERDHEMRELPNCCHVFHRDCLDKWMDQHHTTCPTCRSNLLPS